MTKRINRRAFLQQSTLSAAGLLLARPLLGGARQLSPNEKLNIGMVGVANRAHEDLMGVATENIVAICDVDDKFLAKASQQFPAAKTYSDFRRLLDRTDLDAVVVGTPDHTHAVAAVGALESGRHVYCEKPLTRTISECRAVVDAARKNKRVTQIGTQIHAGDNYRRVVELVQTGAIGPVKEVRVWVDVAYGNLELPAQSPPVPSELHYDLWLGPVPFRPYHSEVRAWTLAQLVGFWRRHLG